jgi:hypothetical protein
VRFVDRERERGKQIGKEREAKRKKSAVTGKYSFVFEVFVVINQISNLDLYIVRVFILLEFQGLKVSLLRFRLFQKEFQGIFHCPTSLSVRNF